MKKFARPFATALAVIALTVTVSLNIPYAHAQDDKHNPPPSTPSSAPPPQNQQSADGTANIGFVTTNGDPLTGGFAAGDGTGTFKVTDPKSASGNAATTGAGVSTTTLGPGSATSHSSSITSALVKANGAQTQAGVSGDASAGDWAGTVGNVNNYANGGGIMSGDYSASVTDGTGPVQGSGNASATGDTTATTTGAGTNDVSSTIMTMGSSNGTSDFSASGTNPKCSVPKPTGTADVSGNGVAYAGSLAGNPSGTFAAGSVAGDAAYKAQSPTGAQATGSLAITGATNAVITSPNSVSASASLSSKATAKP